MEIAKPLVWYTNEKVKLPHRMSIVALKPDHEFLKWGIVQRYMERAEEGELDPLIVIEQEDGRDSVCIHLYTLSEMSCYHRYKVRGHLHDFRYISEFSPSEIEKRNNIAEISTSFGI
jgi:hypothetical protein